MLDHTQPTLKEQYKWYVFEEKYFIRPKVRTYFFYCFTQEFLPRFVSLTKQFTENFFMSIQVFFCFVF